MPQRNLTAKVTLLSDLHIGTGQSLLGGFDWHLHTDKYVYFADQAAISATVFDRLNADGERAQSIIKLITGATIDDLLARGWLRADDMAAPGALFPYRLRGTPATREIREQIKNVWGQPYLPGSSFKGALRTILAVAAAKELQPDVRVNRLNSKRAWAAQPVEQSLFGKDPNHDVLRVVQVGDSAPLAATTLRLRRAHIYPTAVATARGRSRGLDIDLEVVAKNTTFELPIHIPVELLAPGDGQFEVRRAAELSDWERRVAWIEKLAAHGRAFARQQLIEEVTYFQTRTDVPAAHLFYNRLVEQFQQLGKGQFMARLGWGGGWHTKTLGAYLRQDTANFAAIVEKYKLNPTGKAPPGAPFPLSRHLLRQPDGEPGEPLGWALVALHSTDHTRQE
jgi:CRISPR-associated protein Csm5